MGGPTSSGSSSEEDENWKAAIKSIASTTVFGLQASGTVSNGSKSRAVAPEAEPGGENGQKAQKVKHYQIKAQKLLDQILEKTLMVVKDSNDDTAVTTGAATNDEGVRLFKNSSAGIVFDHKDEIQRPTKRPRILPGLDIDQNSRKKKTPIYSCGQHGHNCCSKDRVSKSIS
ncbi:hypothetical protein K2173_014748 [Erythroxylum novogranatense]|uniref:Uncharacterized protein n=1 Tax=Erythroxylum novogranatense TaxID=1862640 RepID=A0AAV8TFF8_9ROSI|nr:hypothetical protein K2173_014748 [Erythroxylum novogranatense]